MTIIGAGTPEMPTTAAVQFLRTELPLPDIAGAGTREEGLRVVREACEAGGVLVTASGSVDDLPGVVARNLAPAEAWCNRVAAELLMPAAQLAQRYSPTATAAETARWLSRYFKVSTLAVLVRLRSLGLIPETDFQDAYDTEARALATVEPKEPGGNYSNTFHSRMGSGFPEALTASVRAGATPRQQAFRLLGIKSTATYDKVVEQLASAR